MTTEQDFWKYVTSQLENIASFIPQGSDDLTYTVERRVIDRCKEVIEQLCDERCVFPHISPDGEHGVGAAWHADEFLLHIVVHEDCQVNVSTKTPTQVLRIQPLEEFDLTMFRYMVKALSVHIEDINPNWRECLPD
jgi:hypothetical protein